MSSNLFAQTIVYNEDFEGTTQAVTSTSSGTNSWGLSTALFASGTKSDSCVVTAGDTTILTTNSFSTTGNAFVLLEFDNICKIEYLDAGIIEVSPDNGTTWTQLIGPMYLGNGFFGNLGNKFSSATYAVDWDAANANTQPTNSWWKHETFDISSIAADTSQVKVRFVLIDGSIGNGAAGHRGWFIDNVKITAALSELQPPTITYTAPMLQDSVYNHGPFIIQSTITDVSGIDTALLVYQRNSGVWDTIGMLGGGGIYNGIIDTIPSFATFDTVRYFVIAKDASLSHNVAREPAIGNIQFVIYNSPPPPGCTSPITSFPFVDNFETNSNISSPSCGSIYPVSGWTNVSGATNGWAPHSGGTTSSNTGPTGDHTSGTGIYLYTETSCGSGSYVAKIESPCLDLSSLSAPVLEFWYHMHGSAMGTLDFEIWYGGQWINIWSKSGDQGNMWKKAIVNLIPYKGVTKLRIIGTRGTSYTSDMSIDDIKIWVPPANDAGITALNYPISPAISGTLPVYTSFRNFGSSNLTSVDLNWQINGVNQTPVSWTGLLPPMTSADSILLGNYAFTAGAPTIKLWTSSPNGAADAIAINDTLQTSVVVCDGYLHGSYTVGTPTSDFADIVSAVSALNNCGIDSTVVFNIAPGTYTGQASLGLVNGVSDTSTITFQSATGNPADVIMQYTSGGSSDSYVFKLDGAQYVTIKNMTIKNLGTTYSYAIFLTNGANYNTIDGNIVRSGITTYYNSRAIIFYSGRNEYNTVINNDIGNAYYALYMYGVNTSTKARGNRIENNNIHNFYYYGLVSYYQDSVTIMGNYIHDGVNTNYYGIYAYYNSNGARIINNKIVFSPTSYAYGIYCYGLNYSAAGADTCIIANNMISVTNGSGSIYGLYISNGINSKIVFNSVNITGGSSNARALYQTSGSGGLIIENNNLVNTNGGYALYVNTAAGVSSCDYNNIYTTGSKYAYWGGDLPSLSGLQLSSSDNAHSINVDPSFVSNIDLHASAVGIHQAGTPILEVPEDFDGEVRSLTAPCIGADEFILVNNDAGISALTSPTVTCPGDTANIIVTLKNYGLDTLFTCNINWEINAVAQTSYSFNDTILPSQTMDITLGTYVFSSGVSYDINFWTTSPNGMADLQTSNDSLVFTGFKTAIPAGTYVVGPSSSADYHSIDSVLTDINTYGICGAVVLNIETGTYNSRIVLNAVNGVSATNTLTIQSLTGDSSDVIINYTASGTNPAAVSLANMQYATINALTFNITGTPSKAVAYWGNTDHNTIKSCVFNLPASTLSSIYGFYFNSSSVKYNSFVDNKVVNGYYSVYARGGGSTDLGKGNQFIGNQFLNTRYYGIYLYYQDSTIIRRNTISSINMGSYARGIYSNYSDNAIIDGNNIHLSNTSYSYGMYLYSNDGSSSNPALITNNMINIQGGTGTSYGIYFSGSTYQKISNNSIYIDGTSSNSRCLYVSSGNHNEAKNNIFYATNGYAAYYSNTSSFSIVDFNNYYTTGSKFVYYSGNKANLSALQSASSKDANSTEINPHFLSSSDLHILTGAINASGTPLSYVLVDIDGDLRDTLNPDMGADEFTPATQDISVYSVDMENSFCSASMENVAARFVNTGSDTIMGNLNVQYSLDSGATWVTESSSAILAPFDTLNYTFTNQVDLSSTQDTNFYLLVKGDLPNDPIVYNDTMSLNIFNGILPATPTVSSGVAIYSGSATLTAISSSLVLWYSNDTVVLPLSSGSSYNTGQLFDTTVYYCAALGTNGCSSYRVPDTAYVTGIPSGDVGIASIIVNEGCNIDSNETVSIKIYNQGYGTVNGNLTAMFKVDNGVYSTPESISTSIGSNDTITYTFTATANLYAYWADTTFSINAKVVLTGDPYASNDTLTKSPIEVSYTPVAPVVTSPMAIAYGAFANLTATSNDTINWYNTNNPLDTLPFGSGSPVTVGPLYATDSFYVQSVGGVGGLFTIGTGTVHNSSTSYPTPYGQWYTGCKEQYLILASELYAMGASAGGAIESLAFDVVTINAATSAGHNHDNYTIKMGNSSISSISTWQSGLTQVYTTSSYQTVVGWNTHQFTTPFIWDGVSNIVVEVCFDNYVSGASYSNNAIVNSSNTTFSSSIDYHSDGGNVCPSSTISGTYSKRPNMQLGLQVAGCASSRTELVVNVAPPPAIDAGIDSIISPTSNEVSGVATPIDVKIKNYGTSNLTAVDIVYELDSVIVDTFAWTGSLAFNAISAPITIYTDTFAPGAHNMRVWVQNANGNSTAGINLNDTLAMQFTACLSGVYTLGDSTSDFPTFADALTALNSGGVCGNVTFNIKPGTYNTQIALQPVIGVGPNARITFQSSTGDSTDVIIEATPTGATTNYVLIFFGGSYYTVKNVTIKALGSYTHTVVYYNNASYNTVENCIVESTISTSSNAVPFYDFSSSISSFNTIRNNTIKNGYYGIYLYGPSSYAQKSFVIEGNDISNFYYSGIYSYYQDSTIFKYNKVVNGANSIAYPRGMYIYRNRGPVEIIGNQIQLSGSSYSYGIYYYYGLATPTATGLVANNAISINGGTSNSYGIYSGYTENVTFAYNSINMINTSVTSRAFYQVGGTNLEIVNNVFSGGQSYAYYVNTPGAILTSDYNDLYSTGTKFAYWSGDKSSLTSLKTSSGKETHSMSADPFFYSNSNLHSGSVSLNGAAYPLTSLVPMDMDKEMRSTTAPDIGADEFTPPPNDAGIVSIDAPLTPVGIGVADVHVTLRNFGSDTLTTANIAWSVNSIAQTSYAWAGSLVSGATDDSLNIGSYSFAAGVNNLKIWSDSPNAATDGNNLNDTISMTLIGCISPMHGTYTIGGTSADFASISDAVAQLNSCGIDSNVVFNIYPGTYNEQFTIGEIAGAADTATVTFQSSTLDSTDVMINYSANSGANYVVYLHGSDWIRFVNLSIESLNSTAGRTVVIDGGATHNVFFGNILKAPASTTSSSSVIYSSGDLDGYNTFSHNDILNGYYGIYMKGLSSSANEDSLVFEYNRIEGYYYYGVYFYYLKNLKFDHNKIKNSASTSYGYAAYMYYVNKGIQISNNIIDAQPQNGHSGFYMYYCQATAANPGRIYNNFIGIISNGSSSCYGLYMYNNKYQNVTNNNILIKSSYSYARGLYISSGNNNSILNNSIVVDGAGYTVYVTSGNYVSQSDHNNFYSPTGNFAYWSGSASSLASLQANSGRDANSVSVDPGYMSNFDLHVTSVNLNANATPVSWVTTDIDGELRNATTPDIGADEFSPKQWDAAVVDFRSPSNYFAAQGTTMPITVVLKNFGVDTILTMPVSYVYGNSTPITETWTGNLAPGDTISHTFSTTITTIAGSNTLCAYPSLVADSNLNNDTLCKNFGGISLVTPTYADNFDTPPSMWVSAGTEWELGVPQGTHINTAYSAPNVWMTRLGTNYSDNGSSDLLSPYIDFSNASGAILKFWYNSDLMSNDGVTMYYSTDGGNTWITLGYVGDPLATNWYNNQGGGNQWWGGQSSGWMLATYDLSQFNNTSTPIQFKLHFFSNASGSGDGFAIDNFTIELPPIPYDAGVVSIDAPTSGTIVGSMGNTVSITVKNFGTNTLSSIPVHYTINGVGNVNENVAVSGGLLPDSTTTFTFTTTFQGPVADYTLCAYTSQAGDTYNSNDSSCVSLQANTPPFDAEAAFVSASPSWHDTTKMTYNTVVVLRIKNNGSNAISSVPVQFLIGTTPIASETFSGTINPGDSADYTFTTTYHSPNGNYLLCGKTLLANDANNSNDQTCVALIGINDVGIDLANGDVFSVEQNQPNPAFGDVRIDYFVPKSGKVHFELLNVLGQTIKMQEYDVSEGNQMIKIDADKLAEGVYYYTVEFDGQRITHKMIVNK